MKQVQFQMKGSNIHDRHKENKSQIHNVHVASKVGDGKRREGHLQKLPFSRG